MELKGITIRQKQNGDIEIVIFPDTLKNAIQQFNAPIVTIAKKRQNPATVGKYTHFQPIIKCELADLPNTNPNIAND